MTDRSREDDDAKTRADQEAALKREQNEKAKLAAELDSMKRDQAARDQAAREEAQRQAQEDARRKAETERQRQAQEEAQRQAAQEEARRKAAEEAERQAAAARAASQRSTDGRFTDNGDGTVTDSRTGLMWAARDNGSNINWDNATRYCENYTGGGYSDWRMPTISELQSLYDAQYSREADCGLDVHLTSLIHLTCNWVWSSETVGSSDARYFRFCYGFAYSYARRYSNFTRALPVRSRR